MLLIKQMENRRLQAGLGMQTERSTTIDVYGCVRGCTGRKVDWVCSELVFFRCGYCQSNPWGRSDGCHCDDRRLRTGKCAFTGQESYWHCQHSNFSVSRSAELLGLPPEEWENALQLFAEMSAKLFWHRGLGLKDIADLNASWQSQIFENGWTTESAAPSWRNREDGKARCDHAQCRHWGLWESHWMARSTGPSGWISTSLPWYRHLQHLDERLDFGRELEA